MMVKPIPLLSLMSSPSPNALCNPGLVDVVHQVRGGAQVAPPPLKLAAVAGWRDASQNLFALASYLQSGFWFPRATTILRYMSKVNAPNKRIDLYVPAVNLLILRVLRISGTYTFCV